MKPFGVNFNLLTLLSESNFNNYVTTKTSGRFKKLISLETFGTIEPRKHTQTVNEQNPESY